MTHSVPTSLPASPGPEDWRALARSAPWLWSALEVLLVEVRSDRVPAEPVRLRLTRGSELAYAESPQGIALQPGDTSGGCWGDASEAKCLELDDPLRRPDGLIKRRPDEVPDPPYWQNYATVALLDPVELSDGRDDEGNVVPGTEVSEVRAVLHAGRPAWAARVRPTRAYEPRCACCALIMTAWLAELEWGAEYAREIGWTGSEADPEYADVVLDVATGIVVHLRVRGGLNDGSGFDVTIAADVDRW